MRQTEKRLRFASVPARVAAFGGALVLAGACFVERPVVNDPVLPQGRLMVDQAAVEETVESSAPVADATVGGTRYLGTMQDAGLGTQAVQRDDGRMSGRTPGVADLNGAPGSFGVSAPGVATNVTTPGPTFGGTPVDPLAPAGMASTPGGNGGAPSSSFGNPAVAAAPSTATNAAVVGADSTEQEIEATARATAAAPAVSTNTTGTLSQSFTGTGVARLGDAGTPSRGRMVIRGEGRSLNAYRVPGIR